MRAVLLILLLLCGAFPLQAAEQVLFAAEPSWLQAVPIPTSATQAAVAGQRYLLVDRQNYVDSSQVQRFSRFVIQISSTEGLEKASQLAFDFDPSYETLTIHKARVWRNGKPLDRLEPNELRVFQREADLAVNVERPQSSGQVCSKLSDYRLRLYASRDYLARHAPITHPRDLRGHRFVGYVEELVFSDELRYLASVVPQAHTPLRSTSVVAQYNVACAGRGLAVLPCFMAAHSPQLVPVLPEVIDVQRTFWIAAPANRRDLARVRALWDFLRDVVARHQDLLMEGSAAGPGE
mgnify:CR=1 FL=1